MSDAGSYSAMYTRSSNRRLADSLLESRTLQIEEGIEVRIWLSAKVAQPYETI